MSINYAMNLISLSKLYFLAICLSADNCKFHRQRKKLEKSKQKKKNNKYHCI
jgi:hypothetical protein